MLISRLRGEGAENPKHPRNRRVVEASDHLMHEKLGIYVRHKFPEKDACAVESQEQFLQVFSVRYRVRLSWPSYTQSLDPIFIYYYLAT